MKKILFDMDGTIADYFSYIDELVPDNNEIKTEEEYLERIINPYFGTDLFSKLNGLPLLDYFNKWYSINKYDLDNVEFGFVSFVGNHKYFLNSIYNKEIWLREQGLLDIGSFIPIVTAYEDRASLANENTFLFDDDAKTHRLFRIKGGHSYLVDPRNQGRNFKYEDFEIIINRFLET